MPFIDASYFERDLLLVVAGGSTGSDIRDHIDTYEPEYLQRALGATLYEAFMTGLEDPTGGDFDPVDFDIFDFNTGDIQDRWLWLRDGHTFTINGHALTWPGFRNIKKQTPIAPYVYYWYKRNKATITTSLGEVQPKTENSTRALGASKMAQAWNKMVVMNQSLLAIVYWSGLYPELKYWEIDEDVYRTINTFNI